MALRAGDFKAERFAANERLRCLAYFAFPGFGLLPAGDNPLSLEFSVSDGRMEVRVQRCVALCPDGTLALIDPSVPEETGGQAPLKESFFLGQPGGKPRPMSLYLEPAGGREYEAGPPLTDEEPPRQPWSYPAHQLRFMETGTVPPETGWLELAKFVVEGHLVQEDRSFFPPCLAVQAHPELRRLRDDIVSRLADGADAAAIKAAQASGEGAPRPEGKFFASLALLCSSAVARLQGYGRELTPRDLLVNCREFLRATGTLFETEPLLKKGSWAAHLSERGAGMTRPEQYFETVRAAFPEGWDQLATGLKTAQKHINLVVEFIGRGLGPIPTPTEDSYDYLGRRFSKVPFHELKHSLEGDGRFQALKLGGFGPRSGGTFLVLIKATGEERERMMRLRVGASLLYTNMKHTTPDLETDRDGRIILILTPPSADPVGAVVLGAPVEGIDLSRLTRPEEDVWLYHKP